MDIQQQQAQQQQQPHLMAVLSRPTLDKVEAAQGCYTKRGSVRAFMIAATCKRAFIVIFSCKTVSKCPAQDI